MLIYTKNIFLLIIFFYIFIKVSLSCKIQEIYYINVDSEKKRNSTFLKNYNRHSIEIPIHRISGIVPNSGTKRITKGELGCSLSHLKVLDKISKKPWGWYLVCEDDCSGNFRLIEKKVRTIIRLHPFIMHINLFSPIKYTNVKKLVHRKPRMKTEPDKDQLETNVAKKSPLSRLLPITPGTGTRTTAYLITPLGAKLGKRTIKSNLKNLPCDMALCYSFIHFLISIRFSNAMIDDESPSTINKINKE